MPGTRPQSRPVINASPLPVRNTSGCAEWCAPLHLVEAAVQGRAYARWFDPNDFMGMESEIHGGTVISLYKHRDTRHYLNIDDQGRTYAYSEPGIGSNEDDRGSYRRIPLIAAMDAVGLWELPWFRSDLESERLGFSYDDRAKHPVVKAALKRMTPQQQRRAIV